MKKFLIIFLLFLVGCNKHVLDQDLEIKNNIKKVNVKSLEFEYASIVHLKDLFEDLDSDQLLDTSLLGEFEIKINNNIIKYKVVDKTEPVINVSNITVIKGKKINLLDKLMCGDNYDRNLKCEIIGEYDFNKIGEYPLKIVAIDSSNNKLEKNFKLKVVEKQTYGNPSYYYFNDLIKNYKTDETLVGIDVSSWQENIDFKKVKNAGCEFVMIRMGYGPKNNEYIFDSKFKQNLENAKKNNLKVGLYFYSYAKDEEEAIKEAKWIINELKGETLDLPIAFDWEIWNGFNSYKINFNDLNKIADAFINEINNNGYKGIIYGSAFYINRVWEPKSNPWLAYYTKNNDFEKPYMMWQLSSTGKIDGINGYVDLNVLYEKNSN